MLQSGDAPEPVLSCFCNLSFYTPYFISFEPSISNNNNNNNRRLATLAEHTSDHVYICFAVFVNCNTLYINVLFNVLIP